MPAWAATMIAAIDHNTRRLERIEVELEQTTRTLRNFNTADRATRDALAALEYAHAVSNQVDALISQVQALESRVASLEGRAG